MCPSISSHPLELIHTDIWGPSPCTSIKGYRYYIVFIDDFSKYYWLYPMVLRSEAYDCFVKFKSLAENLLSCKMKSLQSDGGGEFISHRFQSFLSNMVFFIGCRIPTHPNRMGLLKGNIDM